MIDQHSVAVQTAKSYYDSADADQFYSAIWGGEDIHIGLYQTPHDSIFDASRRTVEYIGSRIELLGDGARVLDIGSGYGGAARYLARNYGCRVMALNLSEVENQRARRMTAEQELDDLVEVIDGSFEELPYPAATFDVVWSQDAILHSGNRTRVLADVARVLRVGGIFAFTDPMQADDCPDGVLQPILDRIHLESLGSPSFYRETAALLGLQEIGYEELTPHLVTHYTRVLEETERRAETLAGRVSREYVERMKTGLQHWIDGGEHGYLTWGIFRFRKA
jgi:sarcosine/dimethylglycine N-methyltransferase